MASPTHAATRANAVPFARDLATFGEQVAVVTAAGELRYADLATKVETLAAHLGTSRRLVMLAGGNNVDTLVAYLAALAGGHPLLLAPGDRPEVVASLIDALDPDVLIRAGDRNQGPGGPAGLCIDERRATPAHVLHPDLALLLSTSGSTGSPKLVRLSQQNLAANAESIAQYLRIGPSDRAATTLPMSYCYGLSVINSHLCRGASLLLTDRSVADGQFWTLLGERAATSFAGVPYTFDLLDRIGFDRMDLPHLRYITQAGGRLAPDRVRHYAQLGQRKGWDFVVMYGQTEATARIAYLPPDLATSRPQCIGVPVPGGQLRLEPLPDWPEPDTGELVYAGPNVMLGYAQSTADLRLGRTTQELRTGDIGRRGPDGLFEVVGRRSRFGKVFGLRIDLRQVEQILAEHGVDACCVCDDERLTVVSTAGADTARIRRLAARASKLPVRVVDAWTVRELPRLINGKPDYPAVSALVETMPREPVRQPDPSGPVDLVALFAEILDRPEADLDSTFVGLGGDSLSYVEMSVRLERVLGHLPTDWHSTPIRRLRPAPARRPDRRWRSSTLETSVALRAISIVLIVGTHVSLFKAPGGAHLLLAVAGFNFARFHLTSAGPMARAVSVGRSIRRLAVASMCWIGLASLLLADNYDLARIFLVHNIFGEPGQFNDFWFIETIVYIMLAALVLLAMLDRVERRAPFALPMILAMVALITRYELVPGVDLATPLVVFWLFALGWAASRASTTGQRLLVTAVGAATMVGFHGDLGRESVMLAGFVLLTWVPAIPSLPAINRVAGLLAGASLYVYLTHWQVFPRLDQHSLVLAVVASLVVGVGYAELANRTTTFTSEVLRRWCGRAGHGRRAGLTRGDRHRAGLVRSGLPGTEVREPAPVTRSR